MRKKRARRSPQGPFFPHRESADMGNIHWSGEWWMVYAHGGSAKVDGHGNLILEVAGAPGEGCERVAWVDVVSHKEAEFNGTHYIRSYGGPGCNYLHAPIWLAPIPWTQNGEMDIEHACPGSCYGADGNYRYIAWKRDVVPYKAEYWDEFKNRHQCRLASNAINWYGSPPNYSAWFSTYYYDKGWHLEHWNGYTGPGVSRPGDKVRVILSIYAFAGSSGTDSRIFTEYGFVPN